MGRSEDLKKKAIADNTQRARNTDTSSYFIFCRLILPNKNEIYDPYPITEKKVDEFICYLADVKKLKFNTIYRTVSTLNQIKIEQDGEQATILTPQIKLLLKGLKHEKGINQEPARAITYNMLCEIMSTCNQSSIEYRNRIILLVGWLGAFRRSEISKLQLQDFIFEENGLIIKIRKSKTDQDSSGAYIGIPNAPKEALFDPVQSIKNYIERYHKESIPTDPFFPRIGRHLKESYLLPAKYRPISAHGVNEAIVYHGKQAGYRISSHGLRRGLITELAKLGVPERHIMMLSRHKSTATMRRYIEQGTAIERSPLNQFFFSTPIAAGHFREPQVLVRLKGPADVGKFFDVPS